MQTDPYGTVIVKALRDQPASKRMRGSVASVVRPSIFEEGGYTGYMPPSRSRCGRVDYSNPLGAKRVVAFARAFRRVNIEWLHDLGHRCREYLRFCAVDMDSPYRKFLDEQGFAQTAFSYGLIQVYKASDHYGNMRFDSDASAA